MLLKELICKFLLWEGVVLKELFNKFLLWESGSLERTHF